MIAFAILVGLFGFGRLTTNIARVRWWFVGIVGVWGIIYLLNTGAWFLILKDERRSVGFRRAFQICVSGFAIDYVIPFVGLGGEPYRVLALKDIMGMHDSVSAVIIYSMLHFLSSFLFWTAAIVAIVFAVPLPDDAKAVLGIVLIVSVVSARFIISRHANGIFAPLIRLLQKVPSMRKVSATLEEKKKTLLEIDCKITDFYRKRKRTFYLALSLELVARLVAPLEYLFILKSVGITISFLQAIYISAGFSLVSNVLFFVPFEMGVREGTLYLILKSLGLTSGIGIFVAVVTRIREIFWILVGLIMVQLSGRSVRHLTVPDLLSSEEIAVESTFSDESEK